MNILFVGDINGRPGRKIASEIIPEIRKKYNIDFVIANGENAAGGFGITLKIFKKLEKYGIDCITSGNHLWDKKEIINELDKIPNLLKPANYPIETKGRGSQVFNNKIGVINLLGKSYLLANINCPFATAIKEIDNLNTKITIIDFHAENPYEKMALAYFLDGKVSAVIGTHIHVQTADEKILPNGTAYITDVGMTGSFDSVIGILPQKSINYFIYLTPQRFDSAKGNEHLNGVILEIDEITGKTLSIKRLQI